MDGHGYQFLLAKNENGIVRNDFSYLGRLNFCNQNLNVQLEKLLIVLNLLDYKTDLHTKYLCTKTNKQKATTNKPVS